MMKKDLDICIGTVGYPTFPKCYSIIKKIAQSDSRVKNIFVIKDKFPTSEWLNEMRRLSQSTWTLQIDEDMYLHENAINDLLELAKNKTNRGIKVLNASGLLYDLFLNTNIGSLKLWNTEAFKYGSFKNVSGSDRQFAKDLSESGFQNVEISKVLGEHDSAPDERIAFFKYKEYIQKMKKFSNQKSAERFVKHLENIKKKRRDKIGDYAYAGGVLGLKENLDNTTKNFLNNVLTDEIIVKIKEINSNG